MDELLKFAEIYITTREYREISMVVTLLETQPMINDERIWNMWYHGINTRLQKYPLPAQLSSKAPRGRHVLALLRLAIAHRVFEKLLCRHKDVYR